MEREVRVSTVRLFARFVTGSIRTVTTGGRMYWAWIAVLSVLIASGIAAYTRQITVGLSVTAMRDQVSWGFSATSLSSSASPRRPSCS